MARLDEINLYQGEDNEWLVEARSTDSFDVLEEARKFINGLSDIEEVSLYEDEDNDWVVDMTTIRPFPSLDLAKEYFNNYITQNKS